MQSELFDMGEGQSQESEKVVDTLTGQLDFGDEPQAQVQKQVIQPTTHHNTPQNTAILAPVPQHYKVLARKYRPQVFADMIGQEVLVTTMSNALDSGRVAHAFLLTGIRGVGKTTTARILARAFNCTGTDDSREDPTVEPCGVCQNCVTIAEDRHPDVIEMDAASHTGVNDIREIIENAKYSPISARYKVYIIDEAHMLSNNAFNALLKILEEPPAHTKFILATTETRKIPVTILSRCQKFDLKRVSIEELTQHYLKILANEGYSAEPEAVRLVASAAGGSVRDGLSILDQALSSSGGSALTESMVRQLLGLVDYQQTYELFSLISTGRISEGLQLLAGLYENGADPVLLAEDILEVTHRLSRIKAAGINSIPQSTEREVAIAKPLAESLPMSYLARAWQILLKGFEEVRAATQSLPALEMVLIRLSYCSTMPSLEELVLTGASVEAVSSVPAASATPAAASVVSTPVAPVKPANESGDEEREADMAADSDSEGEAGGAPVSLPTTLQEVAELALKNNEMTMYHQIMTEVRPLAIDGTHMQIALEPGAAKDLPKRLRDVLNRLTGAQWRLEVVASDHPGVEPTMHAKQQNDAQQARRDIETNPIVDALQKEISGLEIAEIVNK